MFLCAARDCRALLANRLPAVVGRPRSTRHGSASVIVGVVVVGGVVVVCGGGVAL
jgi:hypothetical protein